MASSKPPVDSKLLITLRKAAEGGNTEAQYRLGMIHADGDGVPLDYREAAKWLQRAANEGHAEAQEALGWLYANGYGVRQDGGVAAQWYIKAATQGLPRSQYLVASMYRVGSNGLAQDTREMLRWYQLAAEQGLASAQNMLGKLLARGTLVKRNPIAAFLWLSLAVLNGSEAAEKELEGLMKTMSESEISEAKALFTDGLRSQGQDVEALVGSVGDSASHQF